MNAKDIIALANSGFTTDQIAKIAKAVEPAPAQPAAKPAQPAANPAPAQPAANPAPAQQAANPAPAQQAPFEYANLLDKMDTLVAQIQQSAILNSAQPKEESADDILAAIIDPPQFHPNNNK